MKMKKNNKGFTLAEILVTVALIVILAAVLINSFSKSTEVNREKGDVSHVDTAYALVYAAYTNERGTSGSEFDKDKGLNEVIRVGSGKSAKYIMWVKFQQTKSGWNISDYTVGDVQIPAYDGSHNAVKVMMDKSSGALTITLDSVD